MEIVSIYFFFLNRIKFIATSAITQLSHNDLSYQNIANESYKYAEFNFIVMKYRVQIVENKRFCKRLLYSIFQQYLFLASLAKQN